jgi:hypothetical protein
MRLIDPADPFYRPKWRRYLLVALPFVWAGVEYSLGYPLWAFGFAAIAGYLAWHLVITWPDDRKD